jgi:transposase-like protein
VALSDVEDFTDPRELAMLAARAINAPNSQLEQLDVDKAMEEYGKNAEEVVRRYAEYRKKKLTPLSGWMYGDENEQKVMERYEKRFKRYLDERLEAVVENTAEYEDFYNNADPLMRAKLSKLRKAYLEGGKKVTFEKLEAEELVKKTLYGAGYDDINTVYYELSNAQDEDMELMIDEKLKELKPVFDSYKKEYEVLGVEEQETLYKKNEKMIGLYGNLKKMDTTVAKLKTMMKKEPEKADEYMNTIRELRTKAIDLINNYNE